MKQQKAPSAGVEKEQKGEVNRQITSVPYSQSYVY